MKYYIDGIENHLSVSDIIYVNAGQTILFDLCDSGHIYGYGNNGESPYPLDSITIVRNELAVGNIQSPVFMCSSGVVIWAETVDLLQLIYNENGNKKLLFNCKKGFKLHLFIANTLTAAHEQYFKAIGMRGTKPDNCFIGNSVFCTWTQYPRAINQERIIGFADEIRDNNYPCSVIIIDDRWEAEYGDLEFAPSFPNPKQMINTLHSKGFKVILWITPFINTGSISYNPLSEKGYLVKEKGSGCVSPITWWGGEAGLIDLTNPAAFEWYKNKLDNFKNEYGVDGFKIDGGDARFQPKEEVSEWYSYCGASGYTDLLLSLAESVSPGMCETRTAWQSQKRNIIWRQGGKDTHWGENNGLKAVLNYGIYMSLLGYDFFIPDMVGGRMLTIKADDPVMSDELFIRFAELSALMPSLQFSYFPWNYCDETNTAVRTMAYVHKALEEYVRALLNDTSKPIIRPVWYGCESEATLTAYGEFMLGDALLVCPVLESGITEQNITFPRGKWIDIYSGNTYKNTAIIKVSCPKLPLFVREENTELLLKLSGILKDYMSYSVMPGIITSVCRNGVDRSRKKTAE